MGFRFVPGGTVSRLCLHYLCNKSSMDDCSWKNNAMNDMQMNEKKKNSTIIYWKADWERLMGLTWTVSKKNIRP